MTIIKNICILCDKRRALGLLTTYAEVPFVQEHRLFHIGGVFVYRKEVFDKFETKKLIRRTVSKNAE